jgi:hypothetical protein
MLFGGFSKTALSKSYLLSNDSELSELQSEENGTLKDLMPKSDFFSVNG